MDNKIVPSREDFLERYIDHCEKRIVNCYQEDWKRYIEVCNMFIEEKVIKKLRTLLIDSIEPVPLTLKDGFTNKDKTEYSIFLFKSDVLAVNDQNVKVGDTLEHDLPVAFKFYINKSRYDRLISGIFNPAYAIKDFNSIVELTMKSLKSQLNPLDFDVTSDTAESITGPDQFQYFTVYLKQKRKYNKSEDLLIRSNSIETLNKYYKQQVEDFEKSKSSEDASSVALLCTAGVAFVATCIAIAIRSHKNKELIDKVNKVITIDEIRLLNDYIAKLEIDKKHIQEDFAKEFYSHIPYEKQEYYTKPFVNIDFVECNKDYCAIFKKEYQKVDNSIGINTVSLSYQYTIDYNYFYREDREGNYVYNFPNETDEKIERTINNFSRKLVGKTLPKSDTKIRKLVIYGSPENHENVFKLENTIEYEVPKTIKDVIINILEKVSFIK